MRNTFIYLLLTLVISSQNLYSQCDFIKPPSIKKINYATREVTFSNVTMNGKATTYLAVDKGEKVKINIQLESKKNGKYCPDCIVQIYWGVRGYASECAKSFYGYQFNRKKSSLKFNAPMEDGIYYVTMGATLDYSCKNNKLRPACSSDNAFAVIKVGNPDPAKRITFEKVNKGANASLKASLIKEGCFRNLDKIEWFFEGDKMNYDNQSEIPLTKIGKYKVVWSNCLGSAEDTYNYTNKEDKIVRLSLNVGAIKTDKADKNDIESLIANNDKFVLESLIFDLGKSTIKPEAKTELDKLAKVMKGNPSMKILLEGHTDRRGSANKNQILSEDRVNSTKEYLVSQGIKDDNIETKGWGHQKPLIITNNVAEGKINRRVEITILSR